MNPVPLNRQDYEKQKGPGTYDQSLFILQNKFRKIPLLVLYYLTKFDDVKWSVFWIISKITSTNLCKPIHDIINYSIFIYPFESGKWRKGKITIMWISPKQKEPFRWNKKHFLSFWRAIIWWKKIKNSRQKL